MLTSPACSFPDCFGQHARKIAFDTIDMGPGDPLQKNLLRVYMEPAWVFPGLVALVDRCWSAGKLQRDDLPELTKTVEAWLSNNQFFDPDSSLAVRRLFAGTVAITSHLMFKAQPGLESN